MKTDRKERLNQSKVVFFDADKTLWKLESQLEGDDYASKGAFDGRNRTFILSQRDEVTRVEDGTKLVLKESVVETLEKLAKEGVIAGIISDNIYEDVEKVSKLLGIWKYFDKAFINIRLWQGTADKNLMIKEVIDDQKFSTPPYILLVDDSETYHRQMVSSGNNFLLCPKDSFPKDIILDYFGLK